MVQMSSQDLRLTFGHVTNLLAYVARNCVVLVDGSKVDDRTLLCILLPPLLELAGGVLAAHDDVRGRLDEDENVLAVAEFRTQGHHNSVFELLHVRVERFLVLIQELADVIAFEVVGLLMDELEVSFVLSKEVECVAALQCDLRPDFLLGHRFLLSLAGL